MSSLGDSTAAFRRSLNDRIRAAARARGVSAQQLQRQFLLQRFLARVFDVPDGPWVLKGGAGLLVRIPGARHSQDVDLARAGTDVATAVAELRELAGRDVGDPLRFVVGDPTSMTGARPGAQVRVDVYLGVTHFDRFPVDLATGGRLVTRLDHARPAPVVDLPGLPELPTFVLYPLADHLADKVCAMYEVHGPHGRPSTRYRDLVDILLIIGTFALDGEQAGAALAAEAARRTLELPRTLNSPGPGWATGYRAVARESSLDPALRDLDTALATAGACLNTLLIGAATPGRWNPTHHRWDH
jgi:Nucleotidyl transferase AbiEii toxin, Type IV TA system